MIKKLINKFLDFNWIQKVTTIIVVFGLITFLFNDIEKAAQVGDFLAGFVGTLALLWLIVSNKQQQQEIKMQSQALELQALELNNSNKISTYNHIQQLMTESITELYDSDVNINDHTYLFQEYLKRYSKYSKIFSKSIDKTEISESWIQWWKFEQSLNIFISKVSFSLKLYLEYKTNKQIVDKMDIDFIEKHLEDMKEVPYLEALYGTMQNLILPLKSTRESFEMFRFAGSISLMLDQDKDLKEEMNKSYFKDMKNRLDEIGIKYPKIYEIYDI